MAVSSDPLRPVGSPPPSGGRPGGGRLCNELTLYRREFFGYAYCDWNLQDKTTLPEPFRLFMSGLDLYAFFVSEVVAHIPPEKRTGATLILDEMGYPEQTREELKRMFKKRNIKHGFNRISMRRSSQEGLIQIADLVAGSILRRDSRKQSEAYDMIAGKIVELIEYR